MRLVARVLISVKRTQTTNILWGNIKTKAWNIERVVLEWTYSDDNCLTRQQKAPTFPRWGFFGLLPLKGYFLRELSHFSNKVVKILTTKGARKIVMIISNIGNTSLPWIEGAKTLHHQHRLIPKQKRLSYPVMATRTVWGDCIYSIYYKIRLCLLTEKETARPLQKR